MPALVANPNTTSSSFWFDHENEVIELPLLLPEWQVIALERAAREQGMTIGQLIRRLFADLFPPVPPLD